MKSRCFIDKTIYLTIKVYIVKKVADYSKEMKARLNFVTALLHDPALLFLDEPTSGLNEE